MSARYQRVCQTVQFLLQIFKLMYQQNTETEGAVLRALEHSVCDGDTAFVVGIQAGVQQSHFV